MISEEAMFSMATQLEHFWLSYSCSKSPSCLIPSDLRDGIFQQQGKPDPARQAGSTMSFGRSFLVQIKISFLYKAQLPPLSPHSIKGSTQAIQSNIPL